MDGVHPSVQQPICKVPLVTVIIPLNRRQSNWQRGFLVTVTIPVKAAHVQQHSSNRSRCKETHKRQNQMNKAATTVSAHNCCLLAAAKVTCLPQAAGPKRGNRKIGDSSVLHQSSKNKMVHWLALCTGGIGCPGDTTKCMCFWQQTATQTSWSARMWWWSSKRSVEKRRMCQTSSRGH